MHRFSHTCIASLLRLVRCLLLQVPKEDKLRTIGSQSDPQVKSKSGLYDYAKVSMFFLLTVVSISGRSFLIESECSTMAWTRPRCSWSR